MTRHGQAAWGSDLASAASQHCDLQKFLHALVFSSTNRETTGSPYRVGEAQCDDARPTANCPTNSHLYSAALPPSLHAQVPLVERGTRAGF